MNTEDEWYGEPHTLIVHSVRLPDGTPFDDGELDYEVEHPGSCVQEAVTWDGEERYMIWACDVGKNLNELDLPWSLRYSGTPVTEPGMYKIQAWGKRAYYHDYGCYEYDGGIGLVQEESEDG